jgi:peptide/nickel transport system substrate-binding protein
MMHRNKWALAAAALGAAAALSLTGCTPGASDGDEESTVLRLGVITPLASFAPWEASWANQAPYLQAVYDTLLRAEPDGTVTEGLATEWEWDETRTVLTLSLRDDVTFTDGEKLTAQVVADYLTRFRDGTSENAAFLAGMTSAEAADEKTVVITMAAPDPSLPVYLTQNAGLVGSPALLDSAEAQTSPVGSGPYTLDEDASVVGSSYVYDANPDYWDPSNVHYDSIEMTYYGDPTALMNAVKGGQVDATNSQSATQIAEAEAAGFTSQTYELNWTGFLLFDRTGAVNPAFADVRVRQAFNYALDREGLLQAFDSEFGTVTTQVFGVNTTAFDKSLDDRYPYDPEMAKDLLAEAGYPEGVDLVMPSNNFVPESQFAIYKEQLAAGGFNVQWDETSDDLFGRMLSGSWAAAPFLLQSDPNTWQAVQFLLLPTSTWNPLHTEDATVAELANIIRTGEEAEADEAALALNEYIVEQAWFAPTYRPISAYFSNAQTDVTLQADNAVPYLWNIRPAE